MNSGKTSRTVLFLLLPLLMLAGACNNSQQKENKRKTTASFTVFQPGLVVSHVPCAADTAESYALYLPSDYTPNHVFPVVFFFDAHARGALVVKKYKNVAQKLGFILVASNNSKNDQPPKLSDQILYHFMKDVEKRFSIDPQRIYTAGFSGGARIAAGIGLFNKSVSGTIGLEAGFPPIRQIPDDHLIWVGVVGDLDFNYLELKNLEIQLNRLGMKNLLIVYPGKHALPPAEIFERAYDFLQLEAMRKNVIPSNQAFIDSVKQSYDKMRLKAQKDHHYLRQMEIDRNLVKNLDSLADVSLYKKEIKRLAASRAIQIKMKRETALNKTEAEYQQKFAESMVQRDAAWWKHQILELYQKKKTARFEDEKLMNQRLLNYLSLISYLYANSSINDGQPEQAKKFLIMYQMVDPENNMVYFLKAEYYALKNQNDNALSSLQEAVDHGYNEANGIAGNQYFQNLKGSPKLAHILNEIKQKSIAKN